MKIGVERRREYVLYAWCVADLPPWWFWDCRLCPHPSASSYSPHLFTTCLSFCSLPKPKFSNYTIVLPPHPISRDYLESIADQVSRIKQYNASCSVTSDVAKMAFASHSVLCVLSRIGCEFSVSFSLILSGCNVAQLISFSSSLAASLGQSTATFCAALGLFWPEAHASSPVCHKTSY